MNSGFLYINKPAGITSFGVIARLRKITGVKRIGHSGTLDPFATGLLIVAVGREATRELDKWLKKDKEYVATLKLGFESSTGDTEGLITQRVDQENKKTRKQEIIDTLKQFEGEIQQTPSAFSALKVNGVRAYKLARRGEEVKIEPRTVTVHKLTIIEYNYPELVIEAGVSTGTYIRTLAQDIGKALGIGAYLTGLKRTKIDSVELDDAVELDNITNENWETFLHPIT